MRSAERSVLSISDLSATQADGTDKKKSGDRLTAIARSVCRTSHPANYENLTFYLSVL